MSTTPRFDLVDIAKTLQKRSKYILIVTIIAAAVGAILHFVMPKQYESTAELFVANPLYADRSNIFRNRNAEFIDYFGNEDDIDKVIAIAESEIARAMILERQNLAKVYGLDTSKLADRMKLAGKFKKDFKITRTEYQGLEMSYTDKDPVIAANVTTEAVAVTEFLYKDFYDQLKRNVCVSLQNKINETDSLIYATSDSASAMTVNRQQIANATREQLIKDRAQYVSLLNEFSTGTKASELSLLRVVSSATPSNKPKGLGLPLTVVAFAFIGFFFSVIWVLLSTYFKALTSVER